METKRLRKLVKAGETLAVNTILLAKGKSRGGSKALDFDVCLSMTVAMGIMTVLQVLTIVKKKQGCILVNGYIRFTKKFHAEFVTGAFSSPEFSNSILPAATQLKSPIVEHMLRILDIVTTLEPIAMFFIQFFDPHSGSSAGGLELSTWETSPKSSDPLDILVMQVTGKRNPLVAGFSGLRFPGTLFDKSYDSPEPKIFLPFFINWIYFQEKILLSQINLPPMKNIG
ncbi:hypothetical protein Fcan01_04423 [Folsomia candida]|uniref:Uncharacterized protein n=1 Tax=Folsomia candida TaxID=158441 RepID=A0A226EPI7_FOLCA|nr:hypothetical protein Fcan01_04423 [Folsomia candida]